MRAMAKDYKGNGVVAKHVAPLNGPYIWTQDWFLKFGVISLSWDTHYLARKWCYISSTPLIHTWTQTLV